MPFLVAFLAFQLYILSVERTTVSSAAAFSASQTPSNNQNVDKNCHNRENHESEDIASFKSKSSASVEPVAPFSVGSEARKEKLHVALNELGVDVDALTTLPNYRGSAALRSYSSFILPKSRGALAVAESPTRASVVANNIFFLMQEYEAHRTSWLHNHDRTLQQVQAQASRPRQPLYIVLDNVRSAANVGNILRACETFLVMQVCLCGSMTPAPPHPQVLKTAMGSADYVPYLIHASTLECLKQLKETKHDGLGRLTVVGVETTSKSIPLWDSATTDILSQQQPLALVFGNELVGIHPRVLEECDELVCIPTLGVKNSLNVATCASIVMWEAMRQWHVEAESSGGCKMRSEKQPNEDSVR